MELDRLTSALKDFSIADISRNARIHAPPLNDDADADASDHSDVELDKPVAPDVDIIHLDATTIAPVPPSPTLSTSYTGSIAATRRGGRRASLFSAELRLHFPLVIVLLLHFATATTPKWSHLLSVALSAGVSLYETVSLARLLLALTHLLFFARPKTNRRRTHHTTRLPPPPAPALARLSSCARMFASFVLLVVRISTVVVATVLIANGMTRLCVNLKLPNDLCTTVDGIERVTMEMRDIITRVAIDGWEACEKNVNSAMHAAREATKAWVENGRDLGYANVDGGTCSPPRGLDGRL